MVKESQVSKRIHVCINLALLLKSYQPVLGQPEGFVLPASLAVIYILVQLRQRVPLWLVNALHQYGRSMKCHPSYDTEY